MSYGKPTDEQLEEAVIEAIGKDLVVIKPLKVELGERQWNSVSRSYDIGSITVHFKIIKPFEEWIDKAYAAQFNQLEEEYGPFAEGTKAQFNEILMGVRNNYEKIFNVSDLNVLQPGYVAQLRVPQLVWRQDEGLEVSNKRSLTLFDQHIIALLRKIDKADGDISSIPSFSEMLVGRGYQLYRDKVDSIPGCFSCHGRNGEGTEKLGVPSILNKSKAELMQALEEFSENRRRDATMYVMNAIAALMSKYDRLAAATYMSMLPGTENQK